MKQSHHRYCVLVLVITGLSLVPSFASSDYFTTNGHYRFVSQYNIDGNVSDNRNLKALPLALLKKQVEVERTSKTKTNLPTLLVKLGNHQMSVGEFEYARAAYSEALEAQRHIDDSDALSLAVCLHNLGHAQEYLRDTTAALQSYKAALDYWLKTSKQLAIADELDNIGDCLYRARRMAEAEPFLKRALAAREATHAIGRPTLEEILRDIAYALHDQGKYQEEQPYLVRADKEASRLPKPKAILEGSFHVKVPSGVAPARRGGRPAKGFHRRA
jgi:tetratricopeptide (TPR) repeat protein